LLPLLLHALNQPLTGLQCSLELAMAGPRRAEQYVTTLRDGLTLAARMRVLVEAMRGLSECQQEAPPVGEPVLLDALLRETLDDLRPVCESRNVLLSFSCDVRLPVRSAPAQAGELLFRLLESALSLSRAGSCFSVTAARVGDKAALTVSWQPGPPPEFSPFSRPELGLLIAQAGWERAGAECVNSQSGGTPACTLRLPLSLVEGNAI
jgi:signal transduction histidine kinase